MWPGSNFPTIALLILSASESRTLSRGALKPMMKFFRAALVAGIALSFTSAAHAASMINTTADGITGSVRLEPGSPLPFTVVYDGWGGDPSAHLISGLSGRIDFTFLGTLNGGKSYAFDYKLYNTSAATSEIRAFGFDIDPTTGLTVSTGAGDLFDLPKLNPNGTVPSEFGSVDFCLKIDGNKNNCASGKTGIAKGDSTSGSFFLNYTYVPTSVTLDRFFVRYQAVSGLTGFDRNVTSAIGRGAPIPEPATWLMLVAGFGGLGVAIRRTRPTRAALA